MKFLMCKPEYYGIEYEINPWMKIQQKVDNEKAQQEWVNLYDTMLRCGATISLLTPVMGWPDIVFTANGGLYYQGKIILSHFKYAERQGELPYFYQWFLEHGFEVANPLPTLSSPHFEGAGDALIVGDWLFAGFGFRTDKDFYEQADFLDHSKLIYCELIDPYFYHIDTCFCPISDTAAIWYPNAFSETSKKEMAKHAELIPVTQEEAKRFACNSVVLDKQIIVPTGCPVVSAQLKQLGFTVYSCDMDEYLKAGGACKCLTLRLD